MYKKDLTEDEVIFSLNVLLAYLTGNCPRIRREIFANPPRDCAANKIVSFLTIPPLPRRIFGKPAAR